jgi:hypothetical protein
MDLFSNESSARVVVVPASDSKIPAAVAGIIRIWEEYKRAAEGYENRLAALRTQEAEARELARDEIYSLILCEHTTSLKSEEVAERAFGAIVHAAEAHFAPAGTRLEIPSRTVHEGCPASDKRNFAPRIVWEYLAATYGNGGGAAKAYRDAARSLAGTLNIKRHEAQKLVGGRVVLSCTIYADRTFGNVLSYHDEERLNQILVCFETLGKWSGLWCQAETTAVSWHRHAIRSCRQTKHLPERANFGDSILVVPFKSKWEFRLSPKFAEQMQLFLGEFGGLT